jgi:glycosyltransferase involved in cell wall biosynthesis
MRILFYPPFKPLNHPNPSGDLIIARGIYEYFKGHGHRIWNINSVRSRWIYWKPWLIPKLLKEQRKSVRYISKTRPDLWITYHTYYKAPDLLGPRVCKSTNLPYVIFQGIFSTKRRKRLKTLPGYLLNKKVLCSSDHVFTNRKEDLINLKRLIPNEHLTYIAPGIYPNQFSFRNEARNKLRDSWGVGDDPVVLSAAMFRPGIKTRGISWVIQACGNLLKKGTSLSLVVAGDGKGKADLQRLAKEKLGEKVRFIGKVPRDEMDQFYSAGDIFAFPGFRESLGMVYLEAQSCGLPVVACSNGGIPEVVNEGETGYLVHVDSLGDFTQAIERLLKNDDLRRRMGSQAEKYIRETHDLGINYKRLENILERLIDAR